jgi:hypothetical protein
MQKTNFMIVHGALAQKLLRAAYYHEGSSRKAGQESGETVRR